MPKENVPCKCLSTIILDPVIKAKKKYYPQTLLEECKYKPKNDKNGEPHWCWFRKSSGNESDNDSNDETESDNEKYNDESDK